MISMTRLIIEGKLFEKEDEECFDEPQFQGPQDGTGPGKGPGKGKGKNVKVIDLDVDDAEAAKKTDKDGKILIDKEG